MTPAQKKELDMPLYEYMESLAGKAMDLPTRSVEYQSTIAILNIVDSCYQENGKNVRHAVRNFLTKRMYGSDEERAFFKKVNREIGQLPAHDDNSQEKQQVTKDGKPLFTGTANECFEFLLHYQPCSVHHALRHEGYKIIPVEEKEENENG